MARRPAHTLSDPGENISNDPAVPNSLPWAVAQANADTSGTAIVIDFDTTGTCATAQTIALASTLLLSNTTPGESVEIDGPTSGVTIAGGGAIVDFQINSGVQATLNGVTITGGNGGSSSGGDISNSGTVTVEDCTIASGSANSSGAGGILNSGAMTVSGSTISGNTLTSGTGGAGGAAAITNTGTLALSNSTVSDNTGFSAPAVVRAKHGAEHRRVRDAVTAALHQPGQWRA